jgi:signal peptidase I
MSDETQARPAAERLKHEAMEIVRALVGAFIVYLLITTVLFRSFYIPSGSMEPTLEVSDHVIVLNFVYGWSRHSLQLGLGNLLPPSKGRLFGRMPNRGDVIVFRHPKPDNREHLIKRVIGLPGDKVQVKEGRLYINGEVVPRKPMGQVAYRDYHGEIERPMLYEETLPGGKRHAIYERGDDEALDNTIVYTVPEGHVFVMGDNRDASADSRVPETGYIPVENIVGQAVTVLFTLHHCKREEGLTCPTGRVLHLL